MHKTGSILASRKRCRVTADTFLLFVQGARKYHDIITL